ncbi:MAG: hypothetical protein ACLUD0_21155 [Eubacterium ramulus]
MRQIVVGTVERKIFIWRTGLPETKSEMLRGTSQIAGTAYRTRIWSAEDIRSSVSYGDLWSESGSVPADTQARNWDITARYMVDDFIFRDWRQSAERSAGRRKNRSSWR